MEPNTVYPFEEESYKQIASNISRYYQFLCYYLTRLNSNVQYIGVDVTSPIAKIFEMELQFFNVETDMITKQDISTVLESALTAVLNIDGSFTLHSYVNSNQKKSFLIQTYTKIWNDVALALVQKKDIIMLLRLTNLAHGHQIVLFISQNQKTIEIWDPAADLEIESREFYQTIEQTIFDVVKLLVQELANYKLVTLRRLQLECPNVKIAPQTKQQLEKIGFEGSCVMWSLWLMSLRVRHVNMKDILALKLKEIETNYGSLTRFITQFAKFFQDNEDLFEHPEQLAKKMLQNESLFVNMCISCSGNAEYICPATQYLYCSEECRSEFLQE